MQIDPSALKIPRLPEHITQPKDTPEHEVESVPFADLVFKLANGVSRGQQKLDETTAQTLTLLANKTVEMPSKIERQVEEDGRVTTKKHDYEERSLLELGFEPTRYQFSEATVEVNFDLTISESESDTEEKDGEFEDSYNMKAGTYNATEERKYSKTLETNATMNAKLEPVPLPVQLSPPESMTPADGDGETGDTQGGQTSDTQDETTTNSESDGGESGTSDTDSTDE